MLLEQKAISFYNMHGANNRNIRGCKMKHFKIEKVEAKTKHMTFND